MKELMNSIPKIENGKIVESRPQLSMSLRKYILLPLKAGFYGFTLVFSVILFVKLLSFLLGINDVFNLDLMDVILASVGFFFMFLIYLLKNFH
jgi:hypothetical protein